MKYSDFIIGQEFLCGGKRWRCTDVGTRVIVAICVSEITITSEYAAMTQTVSKEEAETQGWFNGPPYAVEEIVFDENDMEGCEAVDATTQRTRPVEDERDDTPIPPLPRRYRPPRPANAGLPPAAQVAGNV